MDRFFCAVQKQQNIEAWQLCQDKLFKALIEAAELDGNEFDRPSFFTIENLRTVAAQASVDCGAKAIKSVLGRKSKAAGGKPKRGLSAYIIFGKDERLKIKEEGKITKPTEVTKELGRRWKALSEEEQLVWKELAVSVAPSKHAEPPVKKKRPPSAYILFGKEERKTIKAEGEVTDPKEVTRELGRRWQVLSEEEQQVWKDAAASTTSPLVEVDGVKKPVKKPAKKPAKDLTLAEKVKLARERAKQRISDSASEASDE